MLVHVQLDGSERVLALAELEELVRAGTVGPETPVRSAALTQDRWVPAGELEFYKGLQSSPEAMVRRAWTSGQVPWFTVILVGVQLRIFAWLHWTPLEGPVLERFSRYTPAIIERDELERLVSYGFLHSSFGHVAMNMMFIGYVGWALEGLIGRVNLAVLFLGSVFWGAVLSSVLTPSSQSIGASAGDFGFLAAAAVFGLRWFELLPARARPSFGFVILIYLIFALVNGFVSEERIDNWAHFGGLVAGGIHMALLRPDVGPAWRARNRRISFTALMLMAAGVVGMARLPIPLVPIEEDGLVASRPVWWATGWAPTGESGFTSPVGGGVLVARTTRGERPTTAPAAVGALLADYREVDPYAALLDEKPYTRDGVEGRLVQVGYEGAGGLRQVQAAVFARGRYVHRVVVDVPVAETRARRMAGRVFAGLKLPVPEAVAEAREAGESWRGQLERARAEADLGDPAAARALVDAARAAHPGEPAAAEALLVLLAAYPSADLGAVVEQLLAAFPEDRGVRTAAVRALLAAGDRDAARLRLDEGLASAPGDRKLERLRDELFAE